MQIHVIAKVSFNFRKDKKQFQDLVELLWGSGGLKEPPHRP